MIRALLFDWGNTVMIDFNLPGPMFEWPKVSWVAGAEESLKALSLSYPCYIATNAGQSDSTAVIKGLKRVGADKYFSGVFASADIGYEKPDIRFFQEIIHKLEIPASEIVMIGDNYVKDIIGARNCGMKAVFYNHSRKPGDYPDADTIIFTMEELTSVIRHL
jgi:FMN phosphatase YigB (HAD superfamily)